MVSGGEFDFARAEMQVRAAIDRAACTAYDTELTRLLRSFRSVSHALAHIQRLALEALRELPPEYGGRPRGDVPTFHPLIRLLRRLRAHPSWRDNHNDDCDARTTAVVTKAGSLPWSFREALDELIAQIRHFLRNTELPNDVEPWRLSPRVEVRHWMGLFCFLVAADELGMLREGFTRNIEVVPDCGSSGEHAP